MQTFSKTEKKRAYFVPQVEQVKLDNDIALVLDSLPPDGPGEGMGSLIPEYFNNEPFKTNIA